MNINAEAMEKLIDGEFGNFKALVNVIPVLAKMLNESNAEKIESTTSWHTEEKDLIPEIVVRLRRPDTDE